MVSARFGRSTGTCLATKVLTMSMRRPEGWTWLARYQNGEGVMWMESKGARYAQQPVESQSRDSSQSLFVIQTNTGQERERGRAEKGDGWLQLPRSPATANAAHTDTPPAPTFYLGASSALVQLPARSRSRSGCLFNWHADWQPVFSLCKAGPSRCLRFGCSESDVSDGGHCP